MAPVTDNQLYWMKMVCIAVMIILLLAANAAAKSCNIHCPPDGECPECQECVDCPDCNCDNDCPDCICDNDCPDCNLECPEPEECPDCVCETDPFTIGGDCTAAFLAGWIKGFTDFMILYHIHNVDPEDLKRVVTVKKRY